jgi:hypothetical protein
MPVSVSTILVRVWLLFWSDLNKCFGVFCYQLLTLLLLVRLSRSITSGTTAPWLNHQQDFHLLSSPLLTVLTSLAILQDPSHSHSHSHYSPSQSFTPAANLAPTYPLSLPPSPLQSALLQLSLAVAYPMQLAVLACFPLRCLAYATTTPV